MDHEVGRLASKGRTRPTGPLRGTENINDSREQETYRHE